jgi:hypothetical protein
MIIVENSAQVCHEANRTFCQTLNDYSQLSWHDAPEWQRESAINGVKFHLASLEIGNEPDPSASHKSWLAEKERDGWKYGPVKDATLKEHPCFVSYEELPIDQQAKDYIFGSIVKAFYECYKVKTVQFIGVI